MHWRYAIPAHRRHCIYEASVTTTDEVLEDAPNEAKVFLSYSRKDRERASAIADALRARHFGVFKDTDDILPTEEWRDRLQQLIDEADTVVFLLSPHSANSQVCAWEVEYAHSLNKRIAPIVIDETEAADIPPLLAQLNFIFCTQRDPFENAVDTLASALATDIDWIREHTRLAGLAQRWDKSGRPDRLLLRGQDIADAETWRDGHPKDAPAVTTRQAVFIGASRRAATKRQRSWIGGSFAVAAGAVALAIFAYFQSIEADRQRAEAELQRVVAEENAAEAERQRSAATENAEEAERQRKAAIESAEEADRQRREVSRRLVAQNLRGGDIAEAAKTMIAIDPNSRATKTVLVGLATPEEGALRDRPGEPFLINGVLHYSTGKTPLRSKSIDFPASAWAEIGDDLLLLTGSGRVRRVTKTGKLVDNGPSMDRSTLCGLHRGPEFLTVITHYIRGPNLHSIGVELLHIPLNGGEMRLSQPPANEEFDIKLTSFDGAIKIDAGHLEDACSPLTDLPFNTTQYPGWRGIEPIQKLQNVVFPGPGLEAHRWPSEHDTLSIQRRQVQRMEARGIWSNEISRLWSATERGETGYWVNLLDELSVDDATAFVVLSDAAPQGGGTYSACRVPRGGTGACVSFTVLGAYTSVRAALSPDGSQLAVYGRGLWDDDGDPSNLWVIQDKTYIAYSASDGEVLSVAIAADNRLAALTEESLTIYTASGHVLKQLSRPGKAGAVAWSTDGKSLILFGEDGIAIGNPTTGFRLTPLSGPPGEIMSSGRPRPLWIAQDKDDDVLALGYGRDVVIYDMALGAPLTQPFFLSHPELWDGHISGATLDVAPDGGIKLSIAGEVYERIGWNEGEAEDRLDLKSLFR